MLRLATISFLFVLSYALLSVDAHAQIITDSKKKLKTEKVDKKSGGGGSISDEVGKSRKEKVFPKYSVVSPRSLFRNRVVAPRYSASGPSGIFGKVRVSPRYSPASPFLSGRYTNVSPRYSPGSPFRGKRYDRVARSVGSPFKGKTFRVSPRYSPESPFSSKSFRVSPRYSAPNPFSKSQFNVSPRFSKPNPFADKQFAVSPRYSKPNPFSKRQFNVSPRYSKDIQYDDKRYNKSVRYTTFQPFKGAKYKSVTRFSEGSPFRNKDYRVNPRYSKDDPFKDNYNRSPRYSVGSPFQSKSFKINPRYSRERNLFDTGSGKKFSQGEWALFDRSVTTKGKWVVNFNELLRSFNRKRFEGPFEVPPEDKKEYKSLASENADYEGNFSTKWPKSKDMHPGAKYHQASNISSTAVREGLRKWNIFWVRMNRNQEMPDGTKEKVKEPKFDKKEAEIWND